MRAWAPLIVVLFVSVGCSSTGDACEERDAVAASLNTLGNTPVLSFGGDSDQSPLAAWTEMFETFAADFDDLAETEPEGFDEEIADVQTTIDDLQTLLASDDAGSVERRPRLAMLYAQLRGGVNSLLSELDSACAGRVP